MGRTLIAPLGIAASALLLAAACGGDDSTDAPDPAEADGTADEPTETAATFPGTEWDSADPAELGFDPAELDRIAADAEAHDSHCLVITRDGQIAGEWYWGDNDETSTHEAFSVTKSYTSTLVGIAEGEGLLSLDDQATDYIPAWEDSPSEDITLRNILSNDSGRTWNFSDYVGIVSAPDANAYALDLGQTDPPGTSWLYNDGAIQTLHIALEQATGQNPGDYARDKLFDPIGARHSAINQDADGNTYLFFGLQTTCQDMARFGYLFLQDGNWDGTQVLPEGWVEEATGQPSQDLNAGYGYLWWLNRSGDAVEVGAGEGRPTAETTDRALPDAPEDMFWAAGLGGQIILVDPGSGVVAARLGPPVQENSYFTTNLAPVVTDALAE